MSDIKTYPLTSPQLSIWFTEKMYPGTSISNVAGTLRIKDNICYSLLEKALNCLIKNNEGLRLRICLDESGNPVQYVQSYQYIEVEVKDFSDCEDPIKSLFEWDTQETLKSFELIDHDLYRFIIFKLSDSEGGIYTNIHHIISDAWSLSIISNLVIDYYRCLKNGQTEGVIEKFMPSYVSYIENEQLYKNSSRFEKDELFWNHQFEIPPEMTILKSRKTQQVSTRSKRKTFVVPKKFSAKLQEYCRSNKVSPYPLFLSALAMYINRVCSKEDITIGTPILNRLNLTDKSTVGMFISTIPLRMKIKGSETFTSFSKEVLDLCALTYRHQRYPYEKILKQVRDNHGFTNNLYDIVLSYQNSKFNKATEFDSSTRWHFNGQQSNSLTIHINDRDDEGSLIIDYDYHEELYFDKEIEFLHRHVISLLWHALDNSEKRICSIEMISENERKKILYDFNNTQKEYPKDKTIHQLFEEQVARTPDQVALIFENTQLTYRELNEKANSLARVLRENGVVADTVVAIMVHRSVELIVGILAVLKAGGAYLPLEPEYPDNRIDFIINDSNSRIVLTDNLTSGRISSCKEINIDEQDEYTNDYTNLCIINKPNDLAYIIYTSGTTGEPKGVMIEHASVINFIYAVTQLMDFTKDTIVLSITTACFDIFVFELFTSLLNGSKVVLANEAEQKTPRLACELILKHEITKILTTPSKMRLILSQSDDLRKLKSIKEIMLGGEVFPPDLQKKIRSILRVRLFNGYGPTETTVGVSFKEIKEDNRISVGKPIANTKFYILDEHLNLSPIGVPGELYIGGDGLARGYINKTELTKEKFIVNPFSENEKLYRSGDLGKWFPQGELDILGRTDFQIKINGYRIELEEIRNQILKIRDIKDALVTDKIDGNRKVLCAYVISESKISVKRIRNQLSRHLPVYMIPQFFIEVDNIPTNANGKIDYYKLPEPKQVVRNVSRKRPLNSLDIEILSIWENTLNRKINSIHDVFYEIGGDSLGIISIASQVYNKYKIEIPINDFHKMNTVSKMARYIEKNGLPQRNDNRESNMVLIKKSQKKNADNLFLIHAGNGEINAYQRLSSLVDMTCWGIRATSIDISPKAISINELAQEYLCAIKKIQPEGPYNIMGWCIGGTISFEIISILESRKESVNFFGMINTIAPKQWEDIMDFSLDNELKFVSSSLGEEIKPDDLSDVQSLWKMLAEKKMNIDSIVSSLPRDIQIILPAVSSNFEFFHYINVIRTLHYARANYRPKNGINTQVHFFCAANDYIIPNRAANLKIWSDFCKTNIISYPLPADHYSILNNPAVYELANIINNISDKKDMQLYG